MASAYGIQGLHSVPRLTWKRQRIARSHLAKLCSVSLRVPFGIEPSKLSLNASAFRPVCSGLRYSCWLMSESPARNSE